MLRIAIILLALADGVLHLALDAILFRGNFLGPLPFPSPYLIPLNQLFVLNCVGYVVLAVLFWFAPRLLGSRRWLAHVALGAFAALTIAGWLQFGLPNPRGLGYLSKALEVALIAALAVHAWSTVRATRPVGSTA